MSVYKSGSDGCRSNPSRLSSGRPLRRYASAMGEDPNPHERVSIPLDPETALRALMQVDPESEPVEPEPKREPAPQHDDT